MTNALSPLFCMHTVYIYIYLYMMWCICNYDSFHIFGSMECENKLQIANYKVILEVQFGNINCEGGIHQYRTEGVSCEIVLFCVNVSCEYRLLQSLNVSNTSSRSCVRGLVLEKTSLCLFELPPIHSALFHQSYCLLTSDRTFDII